jgi:hypothetical protein
MNENRMKTSTNTGEVSLPSAKESGLDRKSSNLGQMSPHGYLLRLGNGLLTGQCWREGSKNSENNHLETVNIESNGKSRVNPLHHNWCGRDFRRGDCSCCRAVRNNRSANSR